MSNPTVIAVVVAWNRAQLLRETLDGLALQTRPLDGVVVVDNASSDETPQLIASHPAVTNVVTLPQNYGGAGGFAAGIARAMTLGADLVWIMDDDTIPTPTALEVLLRTREEYPGTPAVLACRADWIDGREHPMNAPRERFLISRELREHAAAVGARQIRTASFVAIMIDARAIEEEGLPEAAYFLWNDDFEYTARLLKGRVGLYVDGARVEHRTKTFGNSTADPGPRFYNEVRNKVWALGTSSGFGLFDRCAFGAATALRWAKMIAASADREAALGYLREGLRDAWRPPLRSSEILHLTEVADEVAALEQGHRSCGCGCGCSSSGPEAHDCSEGEPR